MDIRALTPTYAVSPQIDLSDLTAIKAAGYVAVIDNRPDGEIPPSHHTENMRRAAEEAGLAFFANPVIGGMMTMENVTEQAEAMEAAGGPVLAYCASGNRSSVVWALAHAGQMPTDDLIGIPARFGYQLEGLRGQLDMMAQKG
ncbi:TIGR01244 family sulfur transferase [Pseudorhodobacter ferrugineus]|uniref:TIGR01244 family sulfur transferase n=1 Tax=Pseudorhodobacter ferrugineus TaxID=77008 RepID=UPI0004107459|nr:TIGR01244 family sulfur transferase [Pseudorhodobacter ferrugineus]